MSAAKILVVEDDPVVMEVLTTKLVAEGYEVLRASNGTEAVQAGMYGQPDLMILDLTFANEEPFTKQWDGFGVIGWLRRTMPDTDIPVIIHTGSTSPDLEARAKASGVYGVFRKGAGSDELLAAIHLALHEKQAR